MFGFVLPGNTPLAWFDPTPSRTPLVNMSWFAVLLIVPFSLFIGIVFLRYYYMSDTVWSLLIVLSFGLYASILFIWLVAELKLTTRLVSHTYPHAKNHTKDKDDWAPERHIERGDT